MGSSTAFTSQVGQETPRFPLSGSRNICAAFAFVQRTNASGISRCTAAAAAFGSVNSKPSCCSWRAAQRCAPWQPMPAQSSASISSFTFHPFSFFSFRTVCARLKSQSSRDHGNLIHPPTTQTSGALPAPCCPPVQLPTKPQNYFHS